MSLLMFHERKDRTSESFFSWLLDEIETNTLNYFYVKMIKEISRFIPT